MIATSGPSATYPQLAYRNPLDELVRFLDKKHGKDWAIWEFRAEGTGYPDSEVYNRIWHYPWPDHHPPPFKLIPPMMGSMRAWLHGDDDSEDAMRTTKIEENDGVHSNGKRVVVVHCKAGKGRSGTSLVSYLISEEGWPMKKALDRFTERRMRPGFGAGVSIPSQLRYVGYVQRWADHNRFYIDQQVEVLEVHVWGLREGCKIAIEGFVEDGKTIKSFHVFAKEERDDVGPANTMAERLRTRIQAGKPSRSRTLPASSTQATTSARTSADDSIDGQFDDMNIQDDSQLSSESSIPAIDPSTNAIFRPSNQLILPTSDVNLAVERRSTAGYGWAMVTSVAHVWFNVFFEGNGPEKQPASKQPPPAHPDASGVFTIDWEAMDGIKGSSRKGVQAFNKIAVVWRVVGEAAHNGGDSSEAHELQSGPGEGVEAADPHGQSRKPRDEGRSANIGGMAQDLGLRAERADGADVGKASSVRSDHGMSAPTQGTAIEEEGEDDDSFKGVDRGVKLPGDKGGGGGE